MIDILPYYCKYCGRPFINDPDENRDELICDRYIMESKLSPILLSSIWHPKVSLKLEEIDD